MSDFATGSAAGEVWLAADQVRDRGVERGRIIYVRLIKRQICRVSEFASGPNQFDMQNAVPQPLRHLHEMHTRRQLQRGERVLQIVQPNTLHGWDRRAVVTNVCRFGWRAPSAPSAPGRNARVSPDFAVGLRVMCREPGDLVWVVVRAWDGVGKVVVGLRIV